MGGTGNTRTLVAVWGVQVIHAHWWLCGGVQVIHDTLVAVWGVHVIL